MEPISLLPSEIKKYRKKRRMILLAGLIVVLFILVSTSYYFSLVLSVRNTKAQVEDMQQQRQEVERNIEELLPYEKLYDYAAEVESTMDEVVGDIPDWEVALIELGEATPSSIWFSDVFFEYEKAQDDENNEDEVRGELLIHGYTSDYRDFSDWLKDLEDVAVLEDVDYSFLSRTTYGDVKAYEYEITAAVLPGEDKLHLWGEGVEKLDETNE